MVVLVLIVKISEDFLLFKSFSNHFKLVINEVIHVLEVLVMADSTSQVALSLARFIAISNHKVADEINFHLFNNHVSGSPAWRPAYLWFYSAR